MTGQKKRRERINDRTEKEKRDKMTGEEKGQEQKKKKSPPQEIC